MTEPQDTWTADAIERGDVDAIKRRFREDPGYATSRDHVGDTPLMAAIGFDHVELVDFFLENGVDPDLVGDDGYTPLLAAVESESPESLEVTRLLVAAGADLHQAGWNGWTPLHMAASWGQADKARLLLDAGAEVDRRATIDDERTPLMEAAWGGHPDVVRLLLDHGADPALRDTIHDRTPLEIARAAASGAEPEVLAALGDIGNGVDLEDVLAGADLSPSEREELLASLQEGDLARSYKESAEELARTGDHAGVIRILSEE